MTNRPKGQQGTKSRSKRPVITEPRKVPRDDLATETPEQRSEVSRESKTCCQDFNDKEVLALDSRKVESERDSARGNDSEKACSAGSEDCASSACAHPTKRARKRRLYKDEEN